MLTQLTKRTYEDLKAPRDREPIFEFDLSEHEYLAGVFHYWSHDDEKRTTVDHYIVVWVAVTL